MDALKKIFTITVFLFFAVNISNAQCPTGPVSFGTQAEVNAFPATYPGCTVLPDGADVEIMGNNIVDLSPLSQLTAVLGVLEIRDCPLLTSLTGLNHITTIGNAAIDGFILRDLPALASLSALDSLTSVSGEFTIRTCASITSLTGLNNLVRVNGSLIVRDNALLTSLNGLDSLQFIGETLELVENPQLNSVAALSNVDTIVGGVEGGVFIEDNPALHSLTGLGNNTTVIGSNLDLLFNPNLSVCGVPSICKYLDSIPADGVVNIAGNSLGCNSQAEIMNDCGFISYIEDNADGTYEVKVSPNPVADRFLIVTEFKWNTIDVLDATGRKITNLYFADGPWFSLSQYKPGVYYFKIMGDEGDVEVVKVVK